MTNSLNSQKIATIVEESLNLLGCDKSDFEHNLDVDDFRPDVINECIEMCSLANNNVSHPIRSIHHFSCTGGTLITKCLASMPNVLVLNEVDPLSTMYFDPKNPSFTPTDITSLVRQGNPNVSDSLPIKLFVQNINLICDELDLIGKRLLLRDHSHSHFLASSRIPERPTMLTLLSEHFPTKSVVTVRDPIDSYLSLKKNNWIHFQPKNFDEYCRRYNFFLDQYNNIKIFRYEDFVGNPHENISAICDVLNLPYTDIFVDTFYTFKFSGDSGRKSSIIEPRPRENLATCFIGEIKDSENYAKLIARLNYECIN